ncbi:MAG: hypothetical protein ACI85F_002574 [Bacteroidia bacterium]|jgi:hypothetical protein
MVLQSIDLIRKRISGIRKRCEDSDSLDGINIGHFSSVFEIPTQHWSSIISATGNILMSAPYMAGMEQHPYKGMCFHYLIAYNEQGPIGVLYFQESDIEITDVDDKVNTEEVKVDSKSLFSKTKGVIMKNLDFLKARMLVCGNLYMSGKPAFQFLPEIDIKTQAQVIKLAMDRVVDADRSGKKIRVILVKDITPEMEKEMAELDSDLTRFEVQPNMVVNILPEWKTLDDVFAEYASKYRVRAKKARKMLGDIKVREMTESEIEKHGSRIMDLFKEVEDKADFSMVSIHPRYFLDLKIAMEEKFSFYGFFEGDKLVSFYSLFRAEDENLASFVGMDYTYNRAHSLYQNMLYHYIEGAVNDGVKRLDLARTAMEIKSTVGAEPEMHMLMVKSTNSITNSILRPFIKNINQVEWTQRRPFKFQKDVEKLETSV